jgi:general secretion pathway protein G
MNTLKARLANRNNDENGFTLIELLIVIAILGILSAIVVLSVGGITDRGQASACKSEKQTLLTAKEAYLAKDAANTIAGADSDTLIGGFLSGKPTNYTMVDGVLGLTAAGTAASCSVS